MSGGTPNFHPAQLATEALQHQFLMLSLIKDIRTAIPVQVVAVHPGDGAAPAIGTVDVQPLVQAVSGQGKNRQLWSLKTTYGAKFSRVQAGNTAIILDPAVDDIGLAIVCDRDISSVIAAAGLAGPGSARTHDISDLVYLFTMISAAPITQYVIADADGIRLISPGTITIQGQQINLVGPVNQTSGDVTLETKVTVPLVDATTDVIVPNGGVNEHIHGGVSSGTDITAPMMG